LLAALGAVAFVGGWAPSAIAADTLFQPQPYSPRDTFSDTWVATDDLGRSLPAAIEVGPPRQDRFVGIFYFLWLGAHERGGPHDISRILEQDPAAMEKPDSPLWGPMHAMHHWGESIFGYYRSDDPFVLRKHAQMLADAGVDTVIFDVTNQHTYRKYYMALLRAFDDVRRDGGRTPQVAFLCPFWNPRKVVDELYRDLYRPGLHADLWFRWEGKPFILADPAMIEDFVGAEKREFPARLARGQTLGQSFTVAEKFTAAGACFPTWHATDSGMTLTLYRGGPDGERVASRKFENVRDNEWLFLTADAPWPPGMYYLEMSEPDGLVGWWSQSDDAFKGGEAFANGKGVAGDRVFRVRLASGPSAELREFFTFRKPQPDYFQGPTQPNMWSWLESHPQHLFTNALGQAEQMSVGVAQNAVGGRLGSMSEPGAQGRSFHMGQVDPDPEAVLHGYNFAEQWELALRKDPKFIFVTGWNEWIAGRHNEFNGVRLPVMFVDQFDQEHSRDIEPMKGGHGDNYYHQLASYIRRFKGARPSPISSLPRTIDLASGFYQWADVSPEFRDDAGDTHHRDFPGYAGATNYVNRSGRNDIVAAKVTHDSEHLFFYARARDAISPPAGPAWMMLLIDSDCSHSTGWEGYDFVVNRQLVNPTTGRLERHAGGWNWESISELQFVVSEHEMHLAIPRRALGLEGEFRRLQIDFKWVDNVPANGSIIALFTHGDAAPNGRFNYRYLGR
jgi:hypothetical protein